MQTQPTPTFPRPFPLQELEQIETAIEASERLLLTLHGRHETLLSELDSLTRPEAVVTRARKTVGPGFGYRGAMVARWSHIDFHTDLLRRLWTDFPERRKSHGGCDGAARDHARLRGKDPRGTVPVPCPRMGDAL